MPSLRCLRLRSSRGALLLGLLLAAGCSKGAAPETATQPAAAAAAANAPAAPAGAPLATATDPAPATKWIGGIPYDVFYDRPLEIAADQTALATVGGSASPVQLPQTPASSPTAGPPGGASATPGAPQPSTPPEGADTPIDWAAVAPVESVVEEISQVKNDLQTKLNTLASYNAGWESVGSDATVLAALAGVVEIHPQSVSWKPNAAAARELAGETSAGATKTGRSSYDATRGPFDSLVDLLSGNPPSDKTAPERRPFGEYADRTVLMKRMEQTLNSLKSTINTEQRMNEDPSAVKLKLTLLATLATVVRTEGYDYTAEPDYQQFAGHFVGSAVAAREAVETKNFAGFQSKLAELQKTCNECHGKYAFGGDKF